MQTLCARPHMRPVQGARPRTSAPVPVPGSRNSVSASYSGGQSSLRYRMADTQSGLPRCNAATRRTLMLLRPVAGTEPSHATLPRPCSRTHALRWTRRAHAQHATHASRLRPASTHVDIGLCVRHSAHLGQRGLMRSGRAAAPAGCRSARSAPPRASRAARGRGQSRCASCRPARPPRRCPRTATAAARPPRRRRPASRPRAPPPRRACGRAGSPGRAPPGAPAEAQTPLLTCCMRAATLPCCTFAGDLRVLIAVVCSESNGKTPTYESKGMNPCCLALLCRATHTAVHSSAAEAYTVRGCTTGLGRSLHGDQPSAAHLQCKHLRRRGIPQRFLHLRPAHARTQC